MDFPVAVHLDTMKNTIFNILDKFRQCGYKERTYRLNYLRRHVILHQNFTNLKAHGLLCPFQGYI